MRNRIYRRGDSLIKQLKSTDVPSSSIGVWYMGQETFLLKKEGRFVLIDPYLTDYVDRFPDFEKGFWVRNYPSPLEPGKLDFIDFVLCTHDHMDHMDPDTIKAIASCNGKTQFIVPFHCVPELMEMGVDESRCVGVKADKTVQLGDIRIIPVAAAHDVFHKDNNGNYYELSYIIQWDGLTVFHGGDMKVYPGLIETLKSFDIDIAMLPINGGDWLRDQQDIVGNMGFKEAVDLGVQINADLLVPMHYDLYQVNRENPAYFVDYIYHSHPGHKYHLFQPGERMIYLKEKEGQDEEL